MINILLDNNFKINKENVDKVIVDVNSDTAEEVYHGESRL